MIGTFVNAGMILTGSMVGNIRTFFMTLWGLQQQLLEYML
jgi:hypothetical protein